MPKQAEKQPNRIERQPVLPQHRRKDASAGRDVSPPASPSSASPVGSRAAVRPRPFWLALAGGAGKEDPTETRVRRAAEARPNGAAARGERGKYYEEMARPFEAMSEYAE